MVHPITLTYFKNDFSVLRVSVGLLISHRGAELKTNFHPLMYTGKAGVGDYLFKSSHTNIRSSRKFF